VTHKKNRRNHRTFLPFFPTAHEVPTPKLVMLIVEEVRDFFAPQKRVRIRRIVSPLGGAENLGAKSVRNAPRCKASITPKPLLQTPKYESSTDHDTANKR